MIKRCRPDGTAPPTSASQDHGSGPVRYKEPDQSHQWGDKMARVYRSTHAGGFHETAIYWRAIFSPWLRNLPFPVATQTTVRLHSLNPPSSLLASPRKNSLIKQIKNGMHAEMVVRYPFGLVDVVSQPSDANRIACLVGSHAQVVAIGEYPCHVLQCSLKTGIQIAFAAQDGGSLQ
jgi:hypothetical protein